MERKHPAKKSGNDPDFESTSLSDKLRNHYRRKKSKDFQKRVDAWTQYLTELPVPIPFLVATLSVGWYYGVPEVVSVLYEHDESMQCLHVLICMFLTWQIFISWCGIRFVDSTLKGYKIMTSQIKIDPFIGISDSKLISNKMMTCPIKTDPFIEISDCKLISNEIMTSQLKTDLLMGISDCKLISNKMMTSPINTDLVIGVSDRKSRSSKMMTSPIKTDPFIGISDGISKSSKIKTDLVIAISDVKSKSNNQTICNERIDEFESDADCEIFIPTVASEQKENLLDDQFESTENGNSTGVFDSHPLVCNTKDIDANGQITEVFGSSLWVCNSKDMGTSLSYWQASYCFICKDVKPPRCHHCRICNTCVLKRDHHCYFTGSCVGWRNQRYFITFCFWASVGCWYSSVHLLFFIHKTLWPSIGYIDTIASFAILRCIMGYTSLPVVIYISLTSSILYFALISTRFLIEHLYLVANGTTSFENNCKLKDVRATDARTTNDKFRSVFGNYWLLNWVIPTHIFFPPVEDPVNWPTIKIPK